MIDTAESKRWQNHCILCLLRFSVGPQRSHSDFKDGPTGLSGDKMSKPTAKSADKGKGPASPSAPAPAAAAQPPAAASRSTTQRNSIIDVLADGKTVFTTEDGSKYVGEFKDHKFHGQGELRWADGVTLYKGVYFEGAMQGRGVLKTKAGTYEGEFVRNKMHGRGTFVYEDKSKYVGSFESGERCGKGELVYADGSKYVGSFKVIILHRKLASNVCAVRSPARRWKVHEPRRHSLQWGVALWKKAWCRDARVWEREQVRGRF